MLSFGSIRLSKNNENRVFLSINVGTGQGTSVLEIVNKFSEINKISVPFVFVDREGDKLKLLPIIIWLYKFLIGT